MSGKSKNFLPFEEAREAVRNKSIKTRAEYHYLMKDSFIGLPCNPQEVYKGQWVSWLDWLGTKHIGNPKRFLPFNNALAIVLKGTKKYGIDTERKWQYQKKYGYIRPFNIPYNPQIAYKNSGWVSWSHWLGTDNIRGTLRKYKVNDDFFKKWSVDMAYILGFWWADGYIRERRDRYSFCYGFSICQQTKDKYILENILCKMSSNNPICSPKTRPSMSHFEINSKIIFDDIVKLGGLPRKSKSIRFPNVQKKYVSDFIRGLFDGDGSISLIGNSPHSYICSGSIAFIHDLKNILDGYEINTKIGDNGNRTSPCFLLRFGANDTRKLGRFIYKNIDNKMKLERKYDRFLRGGMYDI